MNYLRVQPSLLLRIRVLMWFLWLALACLLVKPALAQSTYGQVVGTVTDASKSVVPEVSVTLTEVRTNVQRTTTSKADGNYEFVNVPLGQYRIDLDKSGFQKFATQPFPLEARQTVRIDAELVTGTVATEVQVVDAAPLINTENPTIAAAASNRQLQQLPFVFRTVNTTPISAIAVLPEVQKGVSNEYSLSGSLPFQNEVSVDGVLTTNVRRNGIGDGGENIFPSIETIQEIKVSSINNSAEYAQVGDITTITKGGTNQIHGTAFWNYNGNGLNANPNYFNRAIPARTVANNFGGSAGGPVFKGRTFYFGAFERLSIYGLGVGQAMVPESDFRQGNFARLTTPIIDPSTGLAFPGNIIPANRINPVSKIILDQFIRAPNQPDPTRQPNLHRYTISQSTISNQFDARLDHVFSSRHNVFGRYSYKNWDRISPTAQEASGPQYGSRPTRTMAISDNFVIRPNLINEARFGFTTADILDPTTLKGRDFVAATGLKLVSQNLPDITGSSYILISGYTQFGVKKEEPLTTRNFEFADNLTWTHNRHTFKGGFVVLQYNWTSPLNFTGADDFGVFRFDNNLAGGATGTTGNPVANFLLGIPSSVDQTQTGPGVDGSAYHYGAFFQDEWRVNNSITLSLGVRYELHPGFKDNELNITNFLRDTPNGDAIVPNEASLQLAKPAFLTGLGTTKLLTAAQAGYPESLRRTDKNNIAPRFGIAWRPFGNTSTVVRAGYGIYATRLLGAIFNSLTGIHTSDNQTYNNTFDATTRVHGIVWPNTAFGSAGRGESTVGQQNFSTANDPNFRDPYTQQWSLTVERELDRNNVLRLTYSGSHSVKLPTAPDLNQIQPNTIGFINLPRTARPFPNWNRVNTRDMGGDSSYHDLTVQFKGRVLSGLNYTASYKRAKGISNIEDSFTRANSGQFNEEIASRTDNRFNSLYLRGPMAAIPYNRFTTDFIWDLPFGRGKKFGTDMNPVLDAVVGGWTVSSIMTFQSGTHLTPFYNSRCGSGTNCYGTEKVDLVPGQDPNTGPNTPEQWFNKAAFVIPTSSSSLFVGRFGNAGNGIIDGPGFISVDVGAFKEFAIRESLRLRFQTQIRNFPNHPNFGAPEGNLNSANFGRITTLNAGATARVVVVGARLIF
jgi:hypothetical protein